MKVKSIGIFVLSLFLIAGLLQIDAIGNLNPVFHSIAVSIRRVVNWAIDAHSPKKQRITLTGQQGFLNSDSSQGAAPPIVTQPIIPKSRTGKGKWGNPKEPVENYTPGFPKGGFSYKPQNTLGDSAASRRLMILQEMGTPEDPVTELFPETEWYDEIDIENYDWANLLEEGEIGLDEPIRSEVVEPLLDDLKTQIQQKLESNLSENVPKK